MLSIGLSPFIVDNYTSRDKAVSARPSTKKMAYIPHNPIKIDGDTNFSDTAILEGWSGDGSSDFPFIIEGLEIDQGGAAGHCISISSTRVNFTIRNCNLTGASIDPGSGVYLSNVTYGKITDNIFSTNYNGILLFNSSANTITNNIAFDSGYSGVGLQESTFNILYNNTCSDGSLGIFLQISSMNNTLTDNKCTIIAISMLVLV
jgi:parallel beta-helix repeat protein